ncbi:hypothetical protein V1264_011833 [Littorina saxatilis]
MKELPSTPSSDSDLKLRKDLKKRMEAALSSPVAKSFMAGALSGSISTLLLQPLDLVKTRLQMSVNIGSNMGMMNVAISVVRQDTFFGLWHGVWPSLTRCAPGVGIYFATLHYLRSNFGSSNPRALESLCMGMTARCIAGFLILPVTVIKTRYESGTFHYRGMANALALTYKNEGLRGLYSGLAPTLLRDVPFSGIYLMFYTYLKTYNQPCRFGAGLEPLVDFCNGLLGGALASFVTQPADVIKTTMQLNPEKYRHFRTVLPYIYQVGGIQGFWRGIVPRTLRRTLMTALAWTVFEEIMRRCSLK